MVPTKGYAAHGAHEPFFKSLMASELDPRATLGFHAAWNYGPNGRTLTDPEATLMLYSAYPKPVRRWIARSCGHLSHP